MHSSACQGLLGTWIIVSATCRRTKITQSVRIFENNKGPLPSKEGGRRADVFVQSRRPKSTPLRLILPEMAPSWQSQAFSEAFVKGTNLQLLYRSTRGASRSAQLYHDVFRLGSMMSNREQVKFRSIRSSEARRSPKFSQRQNLADDPANF